jgi:tRNA threonylcarbamoyladenosine biosynthesis protein TsaB
VKILAIDTSSRRGSVALLDGDLVLVSLEEEARGAHAERLMPMIDELFARSGWSKTVLDRIAVDVGPGSFTGLRVGIAFAQGVSLGLKRPLFGVCGLEAICRAVPETLLGMRCAVLDARRQEAFVAAYDEAGREVLAPRVIPCSAVAGLGAAAFAGEAAVGLVPDELVYRSAWTDLPHAIWVAKVARELDETKQGAQPLYIRPADAIVPELPPSPLRLDGD